MIQIMIITESESFKFKSEIVDNTNNAGVLNAKIDVPFKYFSNFWITLEMPLINCEIKRILTCSANWLISVGNIAITFAITDTERYFTVVNLLTQDNIKLLKQFNSGFRQTINWNKYQLKISTKRLNAYLDYLIDPSFEGVNRRFALSFENNKHRIKHTGYLLPKVEIKDYNVMTDEKHFLISQLKII